MCHSRYFIVVVFATEVAFTVNKITSQHIYYITPEIFNHNTFHFRFIYMCFPALYVQTVESLIFLPWSDLINMM